MEAVALLLACRLALAGTLAFAGGAKLLDREGTRALLPALGVPRRLAHPAAIALPIGELLLAALLLPTATATVAAGGAAAFLVVASLMLARAAAAGALGDCGCFGVLARVRPNAALARNAVLLVGAVVVAVTTPPPLTVTAALVAFATAVVVAQAWAWRALLRPPGRAAARISGATR